MGGAGGFSPTSCPETAPQADRWMKQSSKVQRPTAENKNITKNIEQEAPVPAVEDVASSNYELPLAIIGFLLLVLGSVAVCARNSRRFTRRPLLEGLE